MAARRESQRLRRAARGRSGAEDEAKDTAEDVKDRGEEVEETATGDKESSGGIFSELKDVASDAALAVLAPVAKKAATSAAKMAVKKGPELLESKLMPMLAEAGGPAGLLETVKDKVTGDGDEDGGGDRSAGDGTGKGRRMPIQQAVDVAAPIDIVYDEFTQFEDWPKFMHRVERVEQKDDSTVVFHEQVWKIRRKWEAEIVEQRPDERIVWESVSGMDHVGVVTFHELADRLTRVELNIDIDPHGPIEKIARGARFAKRAARADLKRFKAWVEMREDDESEGWRGEIEDGEVVGYQEPEDDDREQEEPAAEAEPDEEPDEDLEAEAEPDEEPEAEAEADEPDEEPEEKPKPRRSRTRASSNGNGNGASAKSGGKSKSSSSSSRSRGSSSSKSGGSTTKSRSRGSSNGGGTGRKSRAKSSSR
jgi:uncharacterized membrane protein